MDRVLVVNTDLSPLNFISEIRALKLVFAGRAEIVHLGEKPSVWEDVMTTVTSSYPVPATLRLVNRVSRKFTSIRYRKKVLFNRDEWNCQYCGKKLENGTITVDHVMPSSRGGKTTWKNCVASCRPCNNAKGQRTPLEANMILKRNPAIPNLTHFWELSKKSLWHPDWDFVFRN